MMNREVRICENCGMENDVWLLECAGCGWDLSFSPPVEAREDSAGASGFFLTAPDGAKFPIESELVLGREGALQEYFAGNEYISRRHCRLFVGEGTLFAEDGSLNGTKRNGIFLEKLKPVPLASGDVLGLEDLEFQVEKI